MISVSALNVSSSKLLQMVVVPDGATGGVTVVPAAAGGGGAGADESPSRGTTHLRFKLTSTRASCENGKEVLNVRAKREPAVRPALRIQNSG